MFVKNLRIAPVDIDSLPATVGLNLFVLALLYPTVRTVGVAHRVYTTPHRHG
jgi:hypothetical protein